MGYRIEFKYGNMFVRTLEEVDYVRDHFTGEIERILKVDSIFAEDGELIWGKPVFRDLSVDKCAMS